jgi:tryptophan synthase alpha chain
LNRLSSKLVELKNSNQKALVAYLVAGDPDLDTTLELMHLFVESGVDVIEIGVPFTDPIAEGPTIQRAHDRALKNDISLKMILDLVKKFRTVDQETPIVLMGYLNTFISHIDLVKSADSNSVDSILVVDVPCELNLETVVLRASALIFNALSTAVLAIGFLLRKFFNPLESRTILGTYVVVSGTLIPFSFSSCVIFLILAL